jgi:replicative DNA helicase
MPYSQESERGILGAILMENPLLMEAATLLQPTDFYLSANRKIFAVLMDSITEGGGMDIISLTAELSKREQLSAVGGAEYIMSLTDGAWGSGREQIRQYAKAVRDAALRRNLIRLCEEGIARIQEPEAKSNEIISWFSEELMKLQYREQLSTVSHISAAIPKVIESMKQQAKEDGLLGLTTGLPELDLQTTGIRLAELWVIGALPSRGKTAIGVQIAAANASNGVPTLVFEMEMSASQVGRRLLANRSNVPASKIRDPRFLTPAYDWPNLIETAAEITEWPLWIDDASSLTTQQLATRARNYIRQRGVKLIVVDYLMLVSEPEERETRLKAKRIADTLRRVAKDEHVAVVLLSQLSRPKDKNINARPNMLDLRESGDIEAAAHVVLLLWLPTDDEGRLTGDDEIIVGKNREGKIGPVSVTLDKKRVMFVQRTPEPQARYKPM